MSTDSLMGINVGSGVSTDCLMCKYLGLSVYVFFPYTFGIPAEQCWLSSLIDSRGEAAVLLQRQTCTVIR